MGKIYMTACMKGGCAKTVTTYNLAYSLKEMGEKVGRRRREGKINFLLHFKLTRYKPVER